MEDTTEEKEEKWMKMRTYSKKEEKLRDKENEEKNRNNWKNGV